MTSSILVDMRMFLILMMASPLWVTSSSLPRSVIFRNSPDQFGGALVASVRSWSHPDPVDLIESPSVASARSWSPSSGPLVFPVNGPKTNAGQLAYQREDALRAISNSRPSPPPPRPAKAIHFPPDPPKSNGVPHQLQASASEFRPSPAIPFSDPFEIVPAQQPLKRESATTTTTTSRPLNPAEEQVQVKTGRFIVNGPLADQSIVSITEPTPINIAAVEEEHEELVEAIEHLLDKLNDLERKLGESETERAAERELVRSLAEDKTNLVADKTKLEAQLESLSDRTSTLELKLIQLEEMTREWIDPALLAKTSVGKSNKRGSGPSHCPDQFFSLDESDPKAPCYFINPTANYRKNWQDAQADCKKLGAKLAEPQSAAELQKLTDHLRDKRTDQLGGGYWTGGINPGLLWMWTGTGRPLSGIADGQWTEPSESRPIVLDSGKCLRLSYDRLLQRYALEGSDCMRYLYFVCELPGSDADGSNLPPPLPLQSTTASSLIIVPLLPSSTTTTTTTARSTTAQPTTTVQVEPEAITPRPLVFRSSTASPAHRFRVRSTTTTTTSTTIRPSPRSSGPNNKTGKSVTNGTPQPAPNYVSVLGFRDEDSNQTVPLNDSEELRLAILSDSFK